MMLFASMPEPTGSLERIVNSKNRNGFSSLKENWTGSTGWTGYSYAKTKLS
jgi:hypothetical protein